MKLFIFGLGYTSLYIAQAAKKAGFSVAGTTRSAEKAAWLRGQGIDAITLSPAGRGLLEQATHILSSIPPQEGVDPALSLLSLISNPQSPAPYYGYLSTTGVYGDYQGGWVDEASELKGDSPRLKARIAAENAWREKGGHIFRLAGIYGAGRSALDEVRAGTARRIHKPGQVFSRIHVEDIAEVVLASMHKANPGAIYNVCDDEPAASHEVVTYACELLGKEPPPLIPYEQAQMSPMAQEFYSANRRVKNDRIKHELGVKLKYPTYREGLKALLELA
ncbi:MAG: SDR family oxidoreductase [Alphaproteobacteria bacterium]|nr:SDR family oxidoreductase [Alphaproteobacteria bacterium]